MPRVKLDGAGIEYMEAGSGLPLVFCHEFAGSMECWEAQVSYFSRFYRVIAYNAKGYPPSEVPDRWQEYTWDRQVAVLLGLLDALSDRTGTHLRAVHGRLHGGAVRAGTSRRGVVRSLRREWAPAAKTRMPF